MKVKSRPSFSLNLHPSTKMIVSVIKNVNIFFFFTASDIFVLWRESKEGEVSVLHIVMKKWKLSFWWTDANSVRKMTNILPSSGSMIVEIDAAVSGTDEHK